MKTRSLFFSLLLFLVLPSYAQAAASVIQIWPDKIVYHPDEKAILKVDVTTDSATNQTVTLVFDLVSQLDAKMEIARRTVSLETHRTNSVSFAWNPAPRDFGHAAVVSVLDESGKLLDRKEEFLSVTDDLWKVALLNMLSHFQVVPKTFEDSPN